MGSQELPTDEQALHIGVTVARWPKSRQNISKGAAQNIVRPRYFCGSQFCPKVALKGPENIYFTIFKFFRGQL